MIESAGSFNYVDVLWNDKTIKGISEVDGGLKAGSEAFMKILTK